MIATLAYGRAVRSVHAKSHGVFEGELTVEAGLPPELAQGLFARPGSYRVVMRLSAQPGDILDDAVSAARGMAVKVLGVPGARHPRPGGYGGLGPASEVAGRSSWLMVAMHGWPVLGRRVTAASDRS